jgi:hypothetical protein
MPDDSQHLRGVALELAATCRSMPTTQMTVIDELRWLVEWRRNGVTPGISNYRMLSTCTAEWPRSVNGQNRGLVSKD